MGHARTSQVREAHDERYLRQSISAVFGFYQRVSLLHDFTTGRYDPLRESGAQVVRVDGEQIGGIVQGRLILNQKLVVVQPEGDVALTRVRKK